MEEKIVFGVCEGCGQSKRIYRRGLCSRCRLIRGAGTARRECRRGVGLKPPRGLPKPTWHPPGSPGKLEVLIARAAAGLQLWHPDDWGSE